MSPEDSEPFTALTLVLRERGDWLITQGANRYSEEIKFLWKLSGCVVVFLKSILKNHLSVSGEAQGISEDTWAFSFLAADHKNP